MKGNSITILKMKLALQSIGQCWIMCPLQMKIKKNQKEKEKELKI